jgi:hypothetical protein
MRTPAAARAYALARAYGVTQSDLDAISKAQGGACAICRRPLPGGKWTHVDHDHASGKVRGLLCGTCNVGLGMFQESSELLRCAAEYMERADAPGVVAPVSETAVSA